MASGAEQQLLEGRQLVAYLGGLLEIEVAGVGGHLLFQPADLARDLGLVAGVDALQLLGRALEQGTPPRPWPGAAPGAAGRDSVPERS